MTDILNMNTDIAPSVIKNADAYLEICDESMIGHLQNLFLKDI